MGCQTISILHLAMRLTLWHYTRNARKGVVGTAREEHLEEVRTRVALDPFGDLLGFRVQEVSPGFARVVATFEEKYLSWVGRAHGGWVMALADHAFSLASNTIPGTYVAVEFNINFLGTPETGEEVAAEGHTVHQGKTLGVTVLEVRGKGGRLLATARGTALAIGAARSTCPAGELPGA